MRALVIAAVLALATSAAVAFQFGSSTDENVIVLRLEGTWTVNADISRRLDPKPDVVMPRSIEFKKNDEILGKMQGLFPRFKMAEGIYMSGTAMMNGTEHWFLVLSEKNMSKLVLFTPNREGGVQEPHGALINLIVSRDQSKDLLFIGGIAARESATAYDRMK